MSEIMIGGSRYDDIYGKAYWAKHSLDRSQRHFDIEDATADCMQYLEERKKNRTLGDIAFAEVIRKNPLSKNGNYTRNLAKVKEEPAVKNLFREVVEFNEKNYPKTALLRKKLILNNRFRLNEVLPKLTGLQKFVITYLK